MNSSDPAWQSQVVTSIPRAATRTHHAPRSTVHHATEANHGQYAVPPPVLHYRAQPVTHLTTATMPSVQAQRDPHWHPPRYVIPPRMRKLLDQTRRVPGGHQANARAIRTFPVSNRHLHPLYAKPRHLVRHAKHSDS